MTDHPFLVGNSGTPDVDFSFLQKNKDTIDAMIYPLVEKINTTYHLKTGTSCSGHPQVKGPLISINIPVSSGIYFYSLLLHLCKTSSSKITDPGPRLLNSKVQWDNFTYKGHQVTVPAFSSFNQWKQLVVFEIFVIREETPQTEAETHTYLHDFENMVYELLDSFLHYQTNRIVATQFFR